MLEEEDEPNNSKMCVSFPWTYILMYARPEQTIPSILNITNSL